MDQQTLRFPLARFCMAWLSLQAVCHFAQGELNDLLAGGAAGPPLEDATQEQGYYLQQLFRQYGENGTLSFEGLTRLLLNLGLGKVQVVEIEHEELGHGHVSHLDILEVQENKHLHSHSALDHLSRTEDGAETQGESVTPTRWAHFKDWKHPAGFSLPDPELHTPVSPTFHEVSHVLEPSFGQGRDKFDKEKEGNVFMSSHGHSKLNLLEGVITLDHSVFNHLHEDCLNVSQLLVNFGMNTISKITPEQFTLLCPALLYQIDSRVCIRHLDDVTFDMAGNSLWIGLGWGFLAITLTSLPSALAIILVPLLSREIFQFILTFLVALAVGTLCGDALLHLWPHVRTAPISSIWGPIVHSGAYSQVKRVKVMPEPNSRAELLSCFHEEQITIVFIQAQVSSHGLLSSEEDGILKGLCVLGGIYFLFLTENLMGTLNQIRAKRKRAAGKQPEQSSTKADENDAERTLHTLLKKNGLNLSGAELQSLRVPEEDTGNVYGEVQDFSIEIHNSEDHRTSLEKQTEEIHHHGHSHNPVGTLKAGIADIAWMVILGDGVHNFTDGLAIGAAFSNGLSSGLSTTLAVLCHELPHELGDCAVLLRAGMPLRWVLLFNLLSAFLAYWGMVLGTIVSQNTSQVTPWIFATTAGVFLYVALVDMLPEMLQRHSTSSKKRSFRHFVLQNLGFLCGGGLMLCIALFEEHISVRMNE
ncbi:Zinc transporter ZIP10 [Ophiophagus hannah]|uniref:Zinc transporter ZIP10 n=1 Tax=Ophiophagus hannah TaxID=8665 RepID=V8PIP4_OPHHA|nr:Zinc transporter ZIP10 [Ophiophagus hannah]